MSAKYLFQYYVLTRDLIPYIVYQTRSDRNQVLNHFVQRDIIDRHIGIAQWLDSISKRKCNYFIN